MASTASKLPNVLPLVLPTGGKKDAGDRRQTVRRSFVFPPLLANYTPLTSSAVGKVAESPCNVMNSSRPADGPKFDAAVPSVVRRVSSADLGHQIKLAVPRTERVW